MYLEQKMDLLIEKITMLEEMLSHVEPKPVVKRTETVVEDTKEVEVIPEPTPEKKERKKAPTVKVKIEDLKDVAQKLVLGGVDRTVVKDTIGKYAPQLSGVKESDYEALMADLNSLEA